MYSNKISVIQTQIFITSQKFKVAWMKCCGFMLKRQEKDFNQA
jgi:hypothetical protein